MNIEQQQHEPGHKRGGRLGISVIIPAFNAWATLPQVLEALGPQVQTPTREAFLIDSSTDGRAEELAARFTWLNVVVLEEATLPGRARNRGVAVSKGEYLAFLDADAVPSRHWLDELERSMSSAWDAVASPVVNGTPWHPVGTPGYLLEFAEWLPGVHRTPRHGATCSLLVRRQYLEEVGGFDEKVFPGEDTLLTYPLARRGRLGYALQARVSHINRTMLGSFLTHQVRLGTSFVALCDRLDFPYSKVTTPWGIPFAPGLRLVALALAVRGRGKESLQTLIYLPVILLGILFWTWGLVKGRFGAHR